MKIPVIVFGCVLLALLCAGCAAATSTRPAETALPALPPPTSNPLPAATPEPITWSSVCSRIGERAELQGVLRLPDQLSCTVGNSPDSCTVDLYDPFSAQTLEINLYVSGAPDIALNQMAALSATYTTTDFKVKSSDGELLGRGSLVSVEGKIEKAAWTAMRCQVSDVQQVTALRQLAPPPGMDVKQSTLADAISGGEVDARIQGSGLDKLEVNLKSKADFSLEIVIASGAIFEAQSGGVQNMVVRRPAVVVLQPKTETSMELEVSCASMQKKEPRSSDSFKIAQESAASDLQKLLALPNLAFASQRVQQFAVWTLTDNPGRDAFVGISATGGFGTGPTDEELSAIKDLFSQAGIDPAAYNAFR
jgi:hypothetical protein